MVLRKQDQTSKFCGNRQALDAAPQQGPDNCRLRHICRRMRNNAANMAQLPNVSVYQLVIAYKQLSLTQLYLGIKVVPFSLR